MRSCAADRGLEDDKERGKDPTMDKTARSARQRRVSERERALLTNCWEDLLYFIWRTACPRNISEVHFCVGVHVFNIHIVMANGRHADSPVKMIRKGINTC